MDSERKRLFDLVVEGVEADDLRFMSFSAVEVLSQCTQLLIVAACRKVIDPFELVGKRVSLFVRVGDETERPFHGIVFSAELERYPEIGLALRLEVAPELRKLEIGKNSRIFQEMSIVDVVTKVLEDAGFSSDAFEFIVSGSPPAHENITQYDESDYDFVQRLLCEAGINFLIQNDPDKEKVVFFDDASALLPVDDLEELVERGRVDDYPDTAFEVREQLSVAPDQVMLRDYDLKAPANSPDANAETDAPTGREVYLHPGGHLELDPRAQALLDALRANTHRYEGQTYSPHLEAGRTINLHSERREGIDEELTLVSVQHEGEVGYEAKASAYVNRFVAVPKSVAFRPARAPQPPVIGGTHRAFVTGPAGQELHGDEFGRVKVRFPWDRAGITDDKSSTWLRVGQYPLSGSMVIPRVGFEVLVGYEFGDIDRPYVTWHMYNEESGPPYGSANPNTSSMQSATLDGGSGANELRFDDDGGGEQILMNASYDMTVKVGHTARWAYNNDETVEVGSNRTLIVKSDHVAKVGANRSVSVGAMLDMNVGGSYSDGIGGNQSVTIGAARNVVVKGDHVDQVGGSLTRNIGAMQNIVSVNGHTRKVVGDSKTQVGAAWASTVGKSLGSTVTANRVEAVGALKMIKAKSVAINTEDAYVEDCSAKQIKTGKDRGDTSDGMLRFEAQGGTSIKAKDITFSADNELVFDAGKVTITLKKSGEIKIKAKKVTIKNSDVLNQITHKSN